MIGVKAKNSDAPIVVRFATVGLMGIPLKRIVIMCSAPIVARK